MIFHSTLVPTRCVPSAASAGAVRGAFAASMLRARGKSTSAVGGVGGPSGGSLVRGSSVLFGTESVGTTGRGNSVAMTAAMAKRTMMMSRSMPAAKSPYQILNVPENSDYATVKKAFLTAALKYHPDRASNNGNGADAAAAATTTTMFVQIRHAFETIVKARTATTSSASSNYSTQYSSFRGRNGTDSDSSSAAADADHWDTEEGFHAWLRMETSELVEFSMSRDTAQEVIHVYNTMAQGGRDKGGYWEMARQLAEREAHRIAARNNGGDDDADDSVVALLNGGEPSKNLRRRKPGRS
jgi:DnaJ domain